MQGRLVEIHFQVVLGLRVLDVPVHIHDAWRLLKDLLDLSCQFDLPFVIRPVDFRHQSLQYRRTGRNFRNLDARTEGLGNLVQFRTQPSCNLVALRFAIVPRQQIYLDVSLIGLTAQEVMAHQTVEVVRTGGAGIDLIIGDLGLLAQILSRAPARRGSSAPAAFHRACQ